MALQIEKRPPFGFSPECVDCGRAANSSYAFIRKGFRLDVPACLRCARRKLWGQLAFLMVVTGILVALVNLPFPQARAWRSAVAALRVFGSIAVSIWAVRFMRRGWHGWFGQISLVSADARGLVLRTKRPDVARRLESSGPEIARETTNDPFDGLVGLLIGLAIWFGPVAGFFIAYLDFRNRGTTSINVYVAWFVELLGPPAYLVLAALWFLAGLGCVFIMVSHDDPELEVGRAPDAREVSE